MDRKKRWFGIIAAILVVSGILCFLYFRMTEPVWNDMQIKSSESLKVGQDWKEANETLIKEGLTVNDKLSFIRLYEDTDEIGMMILCDEEEQKITMLHYDIISDHNETKVYLAGLDVRQSTYMDVFKKIGNERFKQSVGDTTIYMWRKGKLMLLLETDPKGNITAFTISDSTKLESE